MVDIDPHGNVVWAWSGFDHLYVNCHPLGLADFEGLGADWSHGNAIVYTVDGNLLLSMRNQNWILKIDYQSGTGPGDIVWRLGDEGGFALAGGDRSQWFYAQHYPNLLEENGSESKLVILDNSDGRIGSSGQPCGAATPCYSRATIFNIGQTTRVANLLWQDIPRFLLLLGREYWSLSQRRCRVRPDHSLRNLACLENPGGDPYQ